MTRHEFSKQVRRDAFARANGKCEGPMCGVKLMHGAAEYHHIKEDFIGGEPTLDNCLVLCGKCHSDITKARRREIDKTRRISDKLKGIKRKSRPIPGSRASGVRKHMNGDVVPW